MPSDRPPIGVIEKRAWIAVVALTSALGLVGMAVSFARVEHAMRPHFGWWSWSVPVAVDVGIAAFTALDLLMAYRGLRSLWLRAVPWALIGVTVYLNVVALDAMEGRVAHAVLPLLWATAVEVAGGAARTIFGMRTARARIERIRRARWWLAPVSSARMWRRMVLREQTSYPAAIVHEDALAAARMQLATTYGRIAWRWRAPLLARLQLRRGDVPDLDALDALAPAGDTGTAPADARQDEAERADPARPVPALDRGLVRAAVAIRDAHERDGRVLSKRGLGDQLRTRGKGVGAPKLDALWSELEARPAASTLNGQGDR